jgi:hypothetical protein
MKMTSFLRDNGKKIMAVVSAGLMISFLLQRSTGSGNPSEAAANRVVATIFDGQGITALQESNAKQEWEMLRHRLYYVSNPGDQQYVPLAGLLGQEPVGVIDSNPQSFLLLVEEARKLGISVSNDQLQDLIRSHLANFPDEADPGYDLARQSVADLLLVNNLLDRVGSTVKLSQPAQERMLALTQQDVSISMVELSAKRHLPDATQPTDQQIQAQYDKYRTQLPDKITDDNPLGFGYSLPDRVKLQFIGFKDADLRDHVKAAKTELEWQTLARRLYRTHTGDFPVPTTAPTTQTLVMGAPDWEHLPPDVTERVYNQVYDTATADLRKKVMEWLNDQLASDNAAYRNAIAKKLPPPATLNGGDFDSDDYMRHLASAAHDQFGVQPVLGFISNGFKSADDLATLENIGTAATEKGETAGQYATTAGSAFASAALLDKSEQLDLWQPSLPVYVGTSIDPKEFYYFRLTGMDPSHPQTLDEARDQVIGDIKIEQAWKATLAEADSLLTRAKQDGVAAASSGLSPAVPVVTTGLFNIYQAESNGQVPNTQIPASRIKPLAKAAADLMSHDASGVHPASVVQFPADRTVALVELVKIQAQWPDASERLRRQAMVASSVINSMGGERRAEWCLYDEAAKRTQFKEVKSSN